jgi:hypothetical protein
LKSSASFRCRATRAIASRATTTVTWPANSLAETTASGIADRIDRTQGWVDASTASTFPFAASFGFSAGGVCCSSANQEALRMTFIRSIFFWRAMIP